MIHPALAPLRMDRLWVTVGWALTLAVGLAALDWAERRFAAAAAGERIILVPADNPDPARRDELRDRLAAEPVAAAAEWRSPAELARQVARRFPQPRWQGLFPADEGWLPWMLEVRPTQPLERLEAIRAFVARREAEGDWRLVLWDGEPLARLVGEREALRAALGFWLVLAALCGAAALGRLAWPARGGATLTVWCALLGGLGPAAVWAAAWLAGGAVDGRALAIGAGAGFILASLPARMLRLRNRRSVSLSISEDIHERVWQDTDSGQ